MTRYMSVEMVMTKDVVTIRAVDRVKDAWLKFMRRGITGAPVVDDEGGLVGVLSVTDINKAVIDRVDKANALRKATMQFQDKDAEEKEELRELALAMRAVIESPVSVILPKGQEVVSLSHMDSLDRAIRLMAEGQFNRIPVVKDGKVVGIITRQDVIKAISMN